MSRTSQQETHRSRVEFYERCVEELRVLLERTLAGLAAARRNYALYECPHNWVEEVDSDWYHRVTQWVCTECRIERNYWERQLEQEADRAAPEAPAATDVIDLTGADSDNDSAVSEQE